MDSEALSLKIQTAADELVSGVKTKIIVRSVGDVLSNQEKKKLTADQTAHFLKITAADRKREWSEARRCEWELDSFPLKTLSHTKREELHFVFAWGAMSPVQGIGIDVELRTRAISEASSARFIDPSERRGEQTRDLSALQFWTIKEAVFKANPENSNTLLPQYRIDSYDTAKKTGICLGPEDRKFSFFTLILDYWVISLAQVL
jgi:hypothetical protein